MFKQTVVVGSSPTGTVRHRHGPVNAVIVISFYAGPLLLGPLLPQLDQIPQISIEILKNSHCPVRRVFRLSDKADTVRKHLVIVTPKVIRTEEQENPPAGLVANEPFLLGC